MRTLSYDIGLTVTHCSGVRLSRTDIGTYLIVLLSLTVTIRVGSVGLQALQHCLWSIRIVQRGRAANFSWGPRRRKQAGTQGTYFQD